MSLKFDCNKAMWAVAEHELNYLSAAALTAHDMLHNKTGAGNDFLGWLDLPDGFDRQELDRIKAAAQKIRSDSKLLVVIGIGGSYLGAKAAIDFLSHSFNLMSDTTKIVYAGNSISSTYLADLVEICEKTDFSINVISKSGTTTEPAIAFRILREVLEKKYGKQEAKKRIFATTDKARGALKKLSDQEGYESFVIPDDVGGRYSVLTAVGLLPIAAAGADVDKILQGAANAKTLYDVRSADNDCYKYAMMRNALYRKGYSIELMVNYEPSLHYFSEWWKQLYGESEGKDNKGIFPAAVDFSTDLHSMGQYIQEGLRNIFETVLTVEKPRKDIMLKSDDSDLDGLNFLAGKTMDLVNKKAFLGTLLAHTDGRVPNLLLNIQQLDEFNFGEMVYFFEKACGISGYILGVNPFDQPGVEAYKKNMFALLGKPGFEDLAEKLQIDKI